MTRSVTCRKIGHRWTVDRWTYDGTAKFSFDTFAEALDTMRIIDNHYRSQLMAGDEAWTDHVRRRSGLPAIVGCG